MAAHTKACKRCLKIEEISLASDTPLAAEWHLCILGCSSALNLPGHFVYTSRQCGLANGSTRSALQV